MVYFIADTHFGHYNIMKYCNRPFKSVDEMDETIINNWNKKVKKSDTVYHLGDFCFKSGKLAYDYLNYLNGNVILIRGNHDDRRNDRYFLNYFDYLKIKINEQKIILCHYPFSVWDCSHHGSWNLFGHCHGGHKEVGKQYDVGVDVNNFAPVSYEEIKLIMETKQQHEKYNNRSGRDI